MLRLILFEMELGLAAACVYCVLELLDDDKLFLLIDREIDYRMGWYFLILKCSFIS